VIDTGALRKAMHEIADRKGDFTLFALLLRTNALGTWDLVVSAPWLESSKLKATRELVNLLANSLGRESLQQFARVEAIAGDDPTVQFILRSFPLEDGELHMKSTDLFGLQIEKGIFFRAWRPGPHKPNGKALQPAAAGPSRSHR
jgi:hypothetical protein